MKTILTLTLITLFATITHASDSLESRQAHFRGLPSCHKGAVFSGNWMVASTAANTLQIEALDASETKATVKLGDDFVDLALDGNDLYALTASQIEHWDLRQMTLKRAIATHSSAAPYAPYFGPAGIEISNGKIFVAHQRLGVSVIDKTSGAFLSTITVKGDPVDLSFSSNAGYILSENAESFRGSILGAVYNFDPATLQVSKSSILNGAPMGSITVVGENIFVGSRFYWRVDRDQIGRKKYISRYSTVYIPKDQFASGKPFIDENAIYYCNSQHQPEVILFSAPR